MASDPLSLTGMARTIPSASGTGMRPAPHGDTAATGAVPGSQPETSQASAAAGYDTGKLDALQRGGSGAVKASDQETVEKLIEEGQKVGLLKVRLFRPWDSAAMVAALPIFSRATGSFWPLS